MASFHRKSAIELLGRSESASDPAERERLLNLARASMIEYVEAGASSDIPLLLAELHAKLASADIADGATAVSQRDLVAA